jgi:cation diffusion facilitator CzcD-associated flavoprotein CzcO
MEVFDVVIIGGGISGIGAAYHLQKNLPSKRFIIFENKATFGGTWELHKYPGIRSDSDLFTFGYSFKPWKNAAIATGDEILTYLRKYLSSFNSVCQSSSISLFLF